VRSLLPLLLAFVTVAAAAQPSGMPDWFDASKTDEAGQPLMRATAVADTTVDGFSVVANYYTLEGNIDDPASALFMSESPALADYARFARAIPSYAFLVVADDEPKTVLSLWQDPADDSFWLLVPTAEGGQFVPTGYEFTTSDPVITEVRGLELLQNGVDADAATAQGAEGQVQVMFNGTAHNVLPFAPVFADVVGFVAENELYQ
jgi:hypothetical protein